MSNKPTILVVCTGNICRSPIAEGLLKKYLSSSCVSVFSAGTWGINGHPASEHGIEVCMRHGIDISGHRSIGINGEMVKKSDIILVMEEEHLNEIKEDFPASAGKIYLLKKYPDQLGIVEDDDTIPDPHGGELKKFEHVYGLLDKEIRRIIPDLKKQFTGEKNSDSQNG